ncbi:MAG: DNA topoisomerase [Microthrixaceae bacterium]|nr:DNA topoisomerase [Microthrixaceae bacterium]
MTRWSSLHWMRCRTTPSPRRATARAALIKKLEDLGVGRPSTYASIITTIMDRGYVWKKGSALVPTFTAFAVVALMEQYFPKLVDYTFTARMEDDLDGIANGTEHMQPWLQRFYFGVMGLIGDDGEIPPGAAGVGGMGLKELVDSQLGRSMRGRSTRFRWAPTTAGCRSPPG